MEQKRLMIQNLKLIDQKTKENRTIFKFEYDYGIYFEEHKKFKKISKTTDRFFVENGRLSDTFGEEKENRPEDMQMLFDEVKKELALFLLLQD